MKKLLVSLLTLIIAVSCVFCLVGCSEVKDGSKIQKIKIVLEIYDADGTATETDIYAELYLNYAPESTAHIIDLIKKGYYDGTCISNVNSYWLEMGMYKYDENGKLVATDYSDGTVKGEFLNNGLKGNKLTVTKGSIVLKRNYDETGKEGSTSQYNTATSGLIFCLSSSASSTFSKNSYCVLGKVLSDDADDDAEDELEQKSSIDKLYSLIDYKSATDDNDNTVITYYYEKAGEGEVKYYTKWTDEDGEAHYAEGAEVDESKELKDTALEDFEELFDKNKNYFLVVPSVKLVIKSVTLG